MDQIDRIFVLIANGPAGSAPAIACLYTGPTRPPSCAPMLRSPDPKLNHVLDDLFAYHLAATLALNAAVHDGAVMLGRPDETSPYLVSGWSYRLFPAEIPTPEIANRGSGFNSCLAMCAISTVDRLYLIKRGSTFRSEKGSASRLQPGQ